MNTYIAFNSSIPKAGIDKNINKVYVCTDVPVSEFLNAVSYHYIDTDTMAECYPAYI